VKQRRFILLKGQNNEDEEQNCRQRENLIKKKKQFQSRRVEEQKTLDQ